MGGQQVVYTAPALPTAKFTGITDFNTAYQQQFNGPPTYSAAHAYASGQVLEAAVNGAKTLDQTKRRDWIKSHTVKTVVGDLKLTMGFNQPVEGGLVVQVKGTPTQSSGLPARRTGRWSTRGHSPATPEET
jgi:ABC-type branched-subunit amino acid transport system substrate-binding protein